MQDAFLALWERWDRVGAMDDPTGYLYRTSMNVFRKRGRRAALAIRKRLALAPDPVPFANIDEQQDVVAALRNLSPKQRAAIVLLDVLDYTSEDAGKALGVSAGTVRGVASRARETLRRQDERGNMTDTRRLIERVGERARTPTTRSSGCSAGVTASSGTSASRPQV